MRVLVGSTENRPELVETVPIERGAGKPRVALSLGPGAGGPLAELHPGDRLRIFAELEVTTDAPDPRHPGLIGNAYEYAPQVEAELLLAADPASAGGSRDAIRLAKPWRRTLTHEQHHGVVTFADVAYDVPREGAPWRHGAFVNVALSAAHERASRGDLLLVGQNEKVPKVVQDMAGVRVVRLRGGAGRDGRRERAAGCLCAAVPISKTDTVAFSHRLQGLKAGEQLLVVGELVADASRLSAPARLSARLFLADDSDQTEPGGAAARVASWKGHLSKFTGFNCIPAEGPQAARKFGVATIRETPPRPLYVNLVAVSASPFGGRDRELPIRANRSFLEVTRYPAELAG